MTTRRIRKRSEELVNAGRIQDAGRLVDDALRLQPFDTELNIAMANVMLAGRQYREAVRVLRELIERRPECADAHFLLGNAYRAMGRPTQAAASYFAVLRQDPRYPGAHHFLGLALMHNGELEAAARALARACELRPEMAATRFRLGSVLQLMGRHGPAIASYQEVLKREPDHPGARTNLALALLAAHREREALDVARAHLRRSPGHTLALANLLYSALASGDERLVAGLLDRRLLYVEHLRDRPEVDGEWLADQATALAHLPPAGSLPPREDRGFSSIEFAPGVHPQLRPLIDLVSGAVARHLAACRDWPDHPWAGATPGSWSLRAWSELQAPGEEEPTHCHPRAFLSGLVYLRARNEDGEAVLAFAIGDEPYLELRPDPVPEVTLEDGLLLLFPSYWFHRATPCPPGARRVALAFDVIPERKVGASPQPAE